VFEHHTENRGTRFEVLLALLGSEKFKAKYPAAGAPSGDAPLSVGHTFTVPGRKEGSSFGIKVANSQRLAVIDKTAAKGVFIVLFLDVTNLGKEPDEPTAFTLRDQQGRTFTSSLAGVLAAMGELEGDYYGSRVQPSLTGRQFEVFDVAPDAAGFTIVPPTP
jgi:hypothetical protein